MKIGVVGCGGIATLAWAPNLSTDSRVEQVFYVDALPTRAKMLAEQSNGIALPNLDALWEQKPDGIVVATNPESHANIVLAGLAAGANVLCEKPLTTNLADAEAIVQKSNATGLSVHVGLHQPLMMAGLIGQINNGAIGRILLIDYSWRDQGENPHGTLADLASHAFSIALAVLGWPVAPEVTVTVEEIESITLLSAWLGATKILVRLEHQAHIADSAYVHVRVTGTRGEVSGHLHTTRTNPNLPMPQLVRSDPSTATQITSLEPFLSAEDTRARQARLWVSLLCKEPLPDLASHLITAQQGRDVRVIEDAAALALKHGKSISTSTLHKGKGHATNGILGPEQVRPAGIA